jgi:hypothetical protein
MHLGSLTRFPSHQKGLAGVEHAAVHSCLRAIGLCWAHVQPSCVSTTLAVACWVVCRLPCAAP